mmetsp:Transcript_31815/g.55194  ORF Transcript_31815/g.55194 Transcript_31815/m.55194 type:complete len:93 (-) Transcript_31815:1341-1619(-)
MITQMPIQACDGGGFIRSSPSQCRNMLCARSRTVSLWLQATSSASQLSWQELAQLPCWQNCAQRRHKLIRDDELEPGHLVAELCVDILKEFL